MLQRLRSRAMREDEGFTLIELLIVIVILGILAAIVVFAVGNSTASAKTSACQADLKTVETAAEAYKASIGTPAPSVDALLTATNDANGVSQGPFLKEKPPATELISVTAGAATSTLCPAS